MKNEGLSGESILYCILRFTLYSQKTQCTFIRSTIWWMPCSERISVYFVGHMKCIKPLCGKKAEF